MGYTCYDPVLYLKRYIEKSTSRESNINLKRYSDYYEKMVPVTIIKLANIQAPDLKCAKKIAINKSLMIIDFLKYRLSTAGEIFLTKATNKNNHSIVEVFPRFIIRETTAFTEPIEEYSQSVMAKTDSDERLGLYLTLFSDAVAEEKEDFRISKLWTLLETMAINYHGNKEDRVRQLLSSYGFYIQPYGEYDLIKLAYKHRNAIVHEGTSNPALVSDDYRQYVAISTLDIFKFTEELLMLVRSAIHMYIKSLTP
jgi:hypothetical protein